MSYTTTGITVLETFARGGRLLIRVSNAHSDKVLQCYVSGVLAATQPAPAALWTCELAPLGPTDLIGFVAVSTDQSDEDLWDDVVAASAAANRLRVRLPQTLAPYGPNDRWRVYRGDAGAATADSLVHSGPIYPGGRRACGFGAALGSAFGYDGAEAAGLGAALGYGEFGFDCELLTWRSEPLPPGAYPLGVSVVDAAGNESTVSATTVTLTTYARPATGLSADSYAAATDTLVLSFTESEDMPNV